MYIFHPNTVLLLTILTYMSMVDPVPSVADGTNKSNHSEKRLPNTDIVIDDSSSDFGGSSINQRYVLSPEELKSKSELAKHGDLNAAKQVSEHYSFGYGDMENALVFLKLAAQLGDRESKRRYGLELLRTARSTADREAGIKWLEDAADEGSASAARSLSMIFKEGRSGVYKDSERASCWRELISLLKNDSLEAKDKVQDHAKKCRYSSAATVGKATKEQNPN